SANASFRTISHTSGREWPESVAYAPIEPVTDLPIGIEDLLAAARYRRRIEGRPVFRFDCLGAGEFKGAVMSLGRERNYHVKIRVFKIIKTLRPVTSELDADLLHGGMDERVVFSGPDAARGNEYTMAVEMPHHSRRHRRADGVLAAGKEHRA